MLSRFPTWSVRKPENARADAVCKVGGAPIGWSRDWPVCALCSLPMSFLGQFTGDPLAPRLLPGHTLFLFTCERDSIATSGIPSQAPTPAFSSPTTSWARTQPPSRRRPPCCWSCG